MNSRVPCVLSRSATAIMSVVVILAAAGCGGPPQADYSKVDLLAVDGTVTLDGSPLANAVITFENPEDSTFAYALTDASGDYVLQFDSVMKGCTPGTKIVRISTTRRIPGLNGGEEGGEGEGDLAEEEMGEESGEEGAGGAAAAGGERVPTQYNRDSELTVEVSSDSLHHDFDLVSN